MKRYIAFFPILVFFVRSSATDSFSYEMFLFGNKIGTMTVTREVKDDGSELYVLETKAKAKILWIKKENYTRYEVIYKDGKLLSSVTKETENGELKRWTKVIREGNRYLVNSYKGKNMFTEIPIYSVVTIFFKDIELTKRIFYEGEAEFCELRKSEEPATWEFKGPDGNRNVYHFEGNRVQTMEFHVSFATIKLVRLR